MAIRVTLDRVLLDRRMSLTELGDRVGITLANLSILKTGKAKAIRFSTLEALCRELNCQPGDILVWDNRCAMHRRDSIDPATRRIMHRTQCKGTPLVAGA
jgi:putative transcriptional regulator